MMKNIPLSLLKRVDIARKISTPTSLRALSTKTLESLAQPPTSSNDTALSLLSTGLDVRRFDTLVHAGPMDYRGIVQEIPNDELDWDTTVFHTIKNPDVTARLKQRFGQRPLWPDSVLQAAIQQSLQLPPPQYTVPPALLQFLADHCEFKNEHADGGFVDHLDFCAEYTARYLTRGSPNVLFLHSICGVNTNLFPLEWPKIPLLQPLLTHHEFLHVQAFPGMLRLLFCDLLDQLWDDPREPAAITMHTFHGPKLTLEGDEFIAHLNYQLVHQIDFNPTQHFDKLATVDPFTRLFFRLHEYLRTRNQLWATVRLDRLAQLPGMTAADEDLPNWEHFLSSSPDEVDQAHAQVGLQMKTYSDAINHDLSYEIHWK